MSFCSTMPASPAARANVPGSFAEMGANAIAFIKALGLKQVDVLGISIGGLVAQEITLQAPDLVRRLVLVGTVPRSGESMDTGTPEGRQIFGASYEHPGRSLASGSLHAVGREPGGRTQISQALSASHERPRSRRDRDGGAGAARGNRQMGRQA